MKDILRMTEREIQILGPLLHRWEPKEESLESFCNKIFNFQPERLSEEARKGCDSPIIPTKGSESSRND